MGLWPLIDTLSAALKILPEVHVEGVLGGSVVIECPLPKTKVRLYLCRETGRTGMCATVVSSTSYTKKEYMGRVTLQLCPDKNLFLVEVTELAESDSGDYACGAGTNTDRGKTQKVTLNVHSEYEPFWEEEPIMPEPPKWFYKFLHLHVPPWFQAPTHASSYKFTSKVTTQAQRTEAPPAHRPSPTTLTIRHPRVSRASSAAATKPPTLPPSTAASKISARERLLGPRTAGYGHHTRLHRQSAPPGPEDARPGGVAAALRSARSARRALPKNVTAPRASRTRSGGWRAGRASAIASPRSCSLGTGRPGPRPRHLRAPRAPRAAAGKLPSPRRPCLP
uniref:Fc mu receptor n=1 Tax=Microcebus murinus TaxID=30608 RepID=A0A8C5VJV2_MICMU